MYELAPAADDGQKASLIGAPAQVKIRRVKLPVLLCLNCHARCCCCSTQAVLIGAHPSQTLVAILACVFSATAISASNNILDVSRRIGVAC